MTTGTDLSGRQGTGEDSSHRRAAGADLSRRDAATAPDAARDADSGFAPRTVAWLTAATAGSLLFLGLLAAFGERPPARPVAGPSTFSWSALGHRGLVELLHGYGFGIAAQQNRDGDDLAPTRPLIVAEPDPAHLAGGALDDLAREADRHRASLVVVLPKWRAAPLPGHPEWVGPLTLLPLPAVQKVLSLMPTGPWSAVHVSRGRAAGRAGQLVACSDTDTRLRRLDLAPVQLLTPHPDLDPVVRCGDGLLIAHYHAHEPPWTDMFVVADPDLLNNQGLGRPGHAAVVYQVLLRSYLAADGAVFDETTHGFHRARGLAARALGRQLLPATLSAVLALALFVWRGTVRLGKPLLPATGAAAEVADGKEVLIANTADLLIQGRHTADSLDRYYRLTLRTVAARLFLPPDLPEGELLRRLAELGGKRQVTRNPRAIVARLRALPERSPEAARRAVELARELYVWQMEMTDGRR